MKFKFFRQSFLSSLPPTLSLSLSLSCSPVPVLERPLGPEPGRRSKRSLDHHHQRGQERQLRLRQDLLGAQRDEARVKAGEVEQRDDEQRLPVGRGQRRAEGPGLVEEGLAGEGVALFLAAWGFWFR